MGRDPQVDMEFTRVVEAGDVAGLRALAEQVDTSPWIDAPRFAFGAPAIVHAAGRTDAAMIDALLEAGADIDARSDWANGPYTALHRLVDGATPEKLALAEHLVARGATVDLHAAAGLGRIDVLREILDGAPDRVSEPGPDGATPLHLARDAGVAEFLVSRGAEVDKRCVDHRSTPAMWAVDGRLDVLRYLIDHGATPDLFQAALLDDVELATRILDADPTAIDVRVRFGQSHAHVGHGDKYVWALGGADTPLELARRRGHEAVYRFLLEHSRPEIRLVQASRRADVAAIQAMLDDEPGLAEQLSGGAAAEALSGSAAGAALLLARGANPNARDDTSGATALHHAAWKGMTDLATVLLDAGADPTLRDRHYDATPLGWANEAGNGAMMNLLLDRHPPDIVDAAWLGDIDRVVEILREAPHLVDGYDGGRISPLRSAASNGRTEVVRVLLEHGADPTLRNPHTGGTALDFAIERGHTEVAELLRDG